MDMDRRSYEGGKRHWRWRRPLKWTKPSYGVVTIEWIRALGWLYVVREKSLIPPEQYGDR